VKAGTFMLQVMRCWISFWKGTWPDGWRTGNAAGKHSLRQDL